MTAIPPNASRLALLAAGAALVLGVAAVVLGIADEVPMAWGYGLACLLQVAPSLAVGYRLREGLGNRGLDGERRTLRLTSHLLRLLALGLAIASILAWTEGNAPRPGTPALALTGAALVVWLGLWMGKRGAGDQHPSLALDAGRARTLAGLAGLLAAGGLLGLAFPWSAPAAGVAMAAWLFLEGRTMAKATTVSLVGCGGCGSCGCG
jgi:hypothetical protein